MLSIRSFARSAPRAVSRVTSSTIRPATRSSPLKSSWKPARTQYTAPFSTSISRRAKATTGDAELVAKLKSEIKVENEMKEEVGIPTSIKDYLENSPFEIIDTPGQEDVVLTRTFGDEKIKIIFSIADLNSTDPESDFQDPALGDDEGEMNQEDPKAAVEPAEDGEGQDDGEQSFPARLNVIIEKSNKGALAVETVVQDGMVVIDNVYYYADASHAHAKTADKLHERQDYYVGPPFANLDEDLQVMLERYLDERGINTALAVFVPDYIDMKEQKEYLRWLENVKGFVEA